MTGAVQQSERDNDWKGRDRRQTTEPVSRNEFVSFQRRLDERMDAQDGRLAEGTQIMVKQDAALERMAVAMFAKDENNEFESPGVMTVMQKINRHVDMMCNFAAAVRKFGMFIVWAGAVLGGLAGAATAAKALGLL